MATKGMKFHWHSCQYCGFMWRHSPQKKERGPDDREKSHVCTECGGITFEQADIRDFY